MLYRCFQFALAIFCLSISTAACVAQQTTADDPAAPAYTTPTLTPAQEAAQQAAAQQAWEAQRAQQALQQPAGFPLAPAEAKYVSDLLDFWETNSQKLQLYQCDFRRYDYDSSLTGYRDPQTNRLAAHSVSDGQIRFAAPDRAKYETTRVMIFDKPPASPGEQAAYKSAESDDVHERWICDGRQIFEYDFANQVLNQKTIPADMKDNPAESPLPFLFGGNKQAIMSRYWVRYVPQTDLAPNEEPSEYWLELFPKRIEDAQSYSKIEMIIARDDFLPKAMHLYGAQYDISKGNEISHYIAFENRQVNNQLAKMKNFFGVFVPTKLPLGWRKVDMDIPNSQAISPSQNQQR